MRWMIDLGPVCAACEDHMSTYLKLYLHNICVLWFTVYLALICDMTLNHMIVIHVIVGLKFEAFLACFILSAWNGTNKPVHLQFSISSTFHISALF